MRKAAKGAIAAGAVVAIAGTLLVSGVINPSALLGGTQESTSEATVDDGPSFPDQPQASDEITPMTQAAANSADTNSNIRESKSTTPVKVNMRNSGGDAAIQAGDSTTTLPLVPAISTDGKPNAESNTQFAQYGQTEQTSGVDKEGKAQAASAEANNKDNKDTGNGGTGSPIYEYASDEKQGEGNSLLDAIVQTVGNIVGGVTGGEQTNETPSVESRAVKLSRTKDGQGDTAFLVRTVIPAGSVDGNISLEAVRVASANSTPLSTGWNKVERTIGEKVDNQYETAFVLPEGANATLELPEGTEVQVIAAESTAELNAESDETDIIGDEGTNSASFVVSKGDAAIDISMLEKPAEGLCALVANRTDGAADAGAKSTEILTVILPEGADNTASSYPVSQYGQGATLMGVYLPTVVDDTLVYEIPTYNNTGFAGWFPEGSKVSLASSMPSDADPANEVEHVMTVSSCDDEAAQTEGNKVSLTATGDHTAITYGITAPVYEATINIGGGQTLAEGEHPVYLELGYGQSATLTAANLVAHTPDGDAPVEAAEIEGGRVAYPLTLGGSTYYTASLAWYASPEPLTADLSYAGDDGERTFSCTVVGNGSDGYATQGGYAWIAGDGFFSADDTRTTKTYVGGADIYVDMERHETPQPADESQVIPGNRHQVSLAVAEPSRNGESTTMKVTATGDGITTDDEGAAVSESGAVIWGFEAGQKARSLAFSANSDVRLTIEGTTPRGWHLATRTEGVTQSGVNRFDVVIPADQAEVRGIEFSLEEDPSEIEAVAFTLSRRDGQDGLDATKITITEKLPVNVDVKEMAKASEGDASQGSLSPMVDEKANSLTYELRLGNGNSLDLSLVRGSEITIDNDADSNLAMALVDDGGTNATAEGNRIGFVANAKSIAMTYAIQAARSEQGDQNPDTPAAPTTANIPVSVLWEDGNDELGRRPASVVLTLTATRVDGTTQQAKIPVEADASGKWSAVVPDCLLIDEGGNPISYAVSEEEADNQFIALTTYEAPSPVAFDGTNPVVITNRMAANAGLWPLVVEWSDDGLEDDRPDEIEVSVSKGGSTLVAQTLSASEASVSEDGDTWTFGNAFDNLALFGDTMSLSLTAGEEPITSYRTTEAEVVNFTTSSKVRGVFLTNSHVPVIDVEASISWDDDNDLRQIRPQVVTMNLYANYEPGDEPIATANVTSDGSGVWTHTFEDVDEVDDQDNPITYYVGLSEITGYGTVSPTIFSAGTPLSLTASLLQNAREILPQGPAILPKTGTELLIVLAFTAITLLGIAFVIVSVIKPFLEERKRLAWIEDQIDTLQDEQGYEEYEEYDYHDDRGWRR